jgi:hypothetical protein
VKAALLRAGQITGRHLSCLKALPGVQNAGSGILLRESRSDGRWRLIMHRIRE